MIPVDQSAVDKGRGDCHRAVIASIFELELEQVPNFRLFPDATWFNIYFYFLYSLGFEYRGRKHDPASRPLLQGDSLNGYFDVAVESRTYGGGILHGVVVDQSGVVVHDPNPNKLWQDVNVVEEGALRSWYIFSPVKT